MVTQSTPSNLRCLQIVLSLRHYSFEDFDVSPTILRLSEYLIMSVDFAAVVSSSPLFRESCSD